jgi:glycosyltransferase involved in cell wall biosynthesis
MASEWRARSTHGTNVVTIPYGIDTDHFRPPTATERQEARAALGLPEDAFVVVFFGRIEPPKGVHVLVDAFGRLVDRCGGDPRLVLLGGPGKSVSPDEAARYREELASACDPGRTQWLAPRRNVVPVVHAADVVVVPSLWAEPFGLVVSESMACGVPVVASRVGGIPEQYGGEFAGLLVEPGDPDALADRLASLIRWRTETPSLGERLRAHVEAARSLPGMTDSLEQLLLDVCH